MQPIIVVQRDTGRRVLLMGGGGVIIETATTCMVYAPGIGAFPLAETFDEVAGAVLGQHVLDPKDAAARVKAHRDATPPSLWESVDRAAPNPPRPLHSRTPPSPMPIPQGRSRKVARVDVKPGSFAEFFEGFQKGREQE